MRINDRTPQTNPPSKLQQKIDQQVSTGAVAKFG